MRNQNCESDFILAGNGKLLLPEWEANHNAIPSDKNALGVSSRTKPGRISRGWRHLELFHAVFLVIK